MAADPAGWTAIRRGRRAISPARSRSAKPLATPERMTPSPEGTRTASGSRGASWAAISSAAVFLPSTVKGLRAVLRLYQPKRSQAAQQSSKASS